MPQTDEYRTMADKCFQSAREASTDDERQFYLIIAQTWLEQASRKDDGAKVRLPPAPRL